MWGEGDPRFQVRVRGNLPTRADNARIAVALVEAATHRWKTTTADGPLRVGLDVARFGTDASACVWCASGSGGRRIGRICARSGRRGAVDGVGADRGARGPTRAWPERAYRAGNFARACLTTSRSSSSRC